MGHRKYAALQEAAKQCEKTDSVKRSGRSTKRSQAVDDAIDDELQSCERAVTDAIDDWLPSSKQDRPPCPTPAECRAAAVPPVEGSTKVYVGVYWQKDRGCWGAWFKPAKEARRKYLGSYATDQLAARARYDHIRDKGLEQFNEMDAPDPATDLMVPRERMRCFVGEDVAAAQAAIDAARASLFGDSLRSCVVDDVKEAHGGLMVWSQDGKRVIVLDPVVFVEFACKSRFGHNRWEIFEGQLRAYGFDCVARDSDTEVARLGWPRALEFKHSSFCRDGGLLEAKKCRFLYNKLLRTATGAARLRYVLETCELPEGFEVTKENARAIVDMFREKNGGSTTFKLDDTEVRVQVSRGLAFAELKRKRAAATPAPSSPKRRRVQPVDAPQKQEALSDVLQQSTLPGVASLDGKGASLTSAAAVSQIRLAADAVNAASTLDMVATRYNTARDISARPPVAAKLGALPGGIEDDQTAILGQHDEIIKLLNRHKRDFENAQHMLPADEASSLIKVWSGHDVHTNLPAMASLVSLDAATRVRLYRATNGVSESGYVDVLPPDRDTIHNVPLLNPEEARRFCQDLCSADDLFKAGSRDGDAKDLINELRARLLFKHLLEARMAQLKAIVRSKKRKRKGGYAAAAASLKRVRKELLDGETPLDRAKLRYLGSKKVERLAAVGIRTVEHLARADITDRALVEAVTTCKQFSVGATTLLGWKTEAIAFLERKFSREGRPADAPRGGLLLNTARPQSPRAARG